MKTEDGEEQPVPTDSFRIRLTAPDHQWSFVFNAADSELMLKRVAELASDPEAPLSPSDARFIGERIAHIRAAETSPIVSAGTEPPVSNTGPSVVTVRR